MGTSASSGSFHNLHEQIDWKLFHSHQDIRKHHKLLSKRHTEETASKEIIAIRSPNQDNKTINSNQSFLSII